MTEHKRTFVVELDDDCRDDSKPVIGRVEHLASGSTLRFRSTETLIAFLREAVHGAD